MCISRGLCCLRWLNNVSAVYLTQVSLLLIGQQDLVDFTPTQGVHNKYSANYS